MEMFDRTDRYWSKVQNKFRSLHDWSLTGEIEMVVYLDKKAGEAAHQDWWKKQSGE